MNRAEAAMVLGVAASFDRRQVADEDATAWAAALPDIDFIEGRDAVVAHYRETRDWIMPADVLRRVKRQRAENTRMVGTGVVPPSALADNPRAEQRWVREYRAIASRGASHDEAVAEACRRLGVAPDTGTPVPASKVRAALGAVSRRMKGPEDA